MPFDIIVDRERQLAALINPGTHRALGPIAAGENAEQQLEAFVGVLEGEVTEYAPWDLMAYWDAYAMTAAEQMAALEDQSAEQLADTNGQPDAPDDELIPYQVVEPDPAPADEAAVTAEATSDAPPVWSSAPRCPNCQATSFEPAPEGFACAICGTPAPPEVVAATS